MYFPCLFEVGDTTNFLKDEEQVFDPENDFAITGSNKQWHCLKPDLKMEEAGQRHETVKDLPNRLLLSFHIALQTEIFFHDILLRIFF